MQEAAPRVRRCFPKGHPHGRPMARTSLALTESSLSTSLSVHYPTVCITPRADLNTDPPPSSLTSTASSLHPSAHPLLLAAAADQRHPDPPDSFGGYLVPPTCLTLQQTPAAGGRRGHGGSPADEALGGEAGGDRDALLQLSGRENRLANPLQTRRARSLRPS